MGASSLVHRLFLTGWCPHAAETNDDGGLKEYKSQKQGYVLRIPSSWEQKEKAGKGQASTASSAQSYQGSPQADLLTAEIKSMHRVTAKSRE